MNVIRYLFNPKILVPVVAAILLGVAGFGVLNQNAAQAASCETNDIVRCGYSNPTDLANKVQGNGELQTIYNYDYTANYGIGDLNDWKARAQHATVYKDGRVVLDDGTVVATNAKSMGREKFNGNRIAINVGGKTYYYSTTQNSFAANSIPAYVLLNQDDHSLQFAALTECGNTVWADSSSYKCQMLNKEKVSDTTYKFTTTVANKNATLTKLVYDFGDGKSQTVTSDFGQAVTHTYAPGKFTAKVTAFFNVGGKEKSDTRVECSKPVEVPQPPKPVFACDSLTKLQVTRTKYSFTVKGKSENATFVSAKFDFGDGQNAADLKGNNETVTTEHDYTKEGTYTVTATLTYKEGVTAVAEKCKVKVTVNQETCADKPNAPECQPPKQSCENTPSLCVLPSTGPVEIIGSALGLGSIAGAGVYYRNSRRTLVDTILKRK